MKNKFLVLSVALLCPIYSLGTTIIGLEFVGQSKYAYAPIQSINWCSSCAYLASSGRYLSGGYGLIETYSFDPLNPSNGLTSLGYGYLGDIVNAVAWCPDCDFLVAGGNSGDDGIVQVYSFDGSQLIETGPSATIDNSKVASVAWCESCTLVAVGGWRTSEEDPTVSNGLLTTYTFDPLSPADGITQLSQDELLDNSSKIYSVAWCPNCSFIAAGGYSTEDDGFVYIYLLQGSTLTRVHETAISGAPVIAITWCDCRYLAVSRVAAPYGIVQVYEFDQDSYDLAAVGDPVQLDYPVKSLAWCGDCTYLAAGGYTEEVQLLSFDPLAGLSAVGSSTTVGTGPVYVSWCGDCEYLAAGGSGEDSSGIIQLFKIRETIPSPVVRAKKSSYRLPTQCDIINTLCWNAVTDAVLYKVYADLDMTVLLAQVTSAPYCYSQHQIIPCKQKTYYVTAVESDGYESDAATITI